MRHSLIPLMYPRHILTALYMMYGDKRPIFCRWRQQTELEGRKSEINESVAYSNSFLCLFWFFSGFVSLFLTMF